ncbi:rbmA [Symbiodinium natans]|uniref:RbmA protein n=1 Tax=Symbiodinium natans TaxID=878477 RepID=A0A812IM82_9DINO|nr:rbmA [Symbiodinium natans]
MPAPYLEEPLYAFWKNAGAGEDTAETPGMRVDVEKYRMKYRSYRLGYAQAMNGLADVLNDAEKDSTLESKQKIIKTSQDKKAIDTSLPIDEPLFHHLSDAKRAEINKYREDYRKYRLGYASGARGEVADLFKRQISEKESGYQEVQKICKEKMSQASGSQLMCDDADSETWQDLDLLRTVSEPAVPSWRPRSLKGLSSTFSGIFSDACDESNMDAKSMFFTLPKSVLPDPSASYIQVPQLPDGSLQLDASLLLAKTPLPKAAAEFSSIHIVQTSGVAARIAAAQVKNSAAKIGKPCVVHDWPTIPTHDAKAEYDALYDVGSDLILQGANRATLLVFIGAGEPGEMALAVILAMLPFRGVQLAYVTPAQDYENPLQTLKSPSGVFEYTATQPERMGRVSLAAIFGPLAPRTFKEPLTTWSPLRPESHPQEQPAPFKIGGLDLPMVTFEGDYAQGVERLASLMVGHYGSDIYPVVSVGETGDALGYGDDLLGALAELDCPGFYFPHASGETCKSPEAYGKVELLKAIGAAKQSNKKVVVIAVGGGVNGNATGMIAAMTGSVFVEVPTTLMHYNDATTSAKKAFSLVVNGQILSKNILGTFYLPQLVFCISETFLTLSKCSVHAAVGEACKTMGMLGIANSKTGQEDWHNILGGVEFASDFTKIIETVGGFEKLIQFLENTRELKAKALALGEELSGMRMERASFGQMANVAKHREKRLSELRRFFHGQLTAEDRAEVIKFLTVINTEIIAAKAMFLAYSDPFEKYRALLFEYAHTLGHGVEAFMNGLYRRATACGLDYSEAFRLHGQCVGMAVLWAGEMSKQQGLLDGDGFLAHQGLLYTFNRFGGYDFAPLRRLCDQLEVSKDEFCEGVLQVVRRDNKRGYCKCSADSSVDQLVRERPGCLLRSSDPDAELRYLVEAILISDSCPGLCFRSLL